jgi:hypothetical protein
MKLKLSIIISSLLISCSTFAQNAITTTELETLEVRMMPFDVRLRTAPYTIQTVSKNKPLTTEVLKDYIVAGSNLKFIAQDQPSNPVAINADARIIVSEDGKSIKIRPKDYVFTPPAPTELYHAFASEIEKLTGQLYKGNPLYQKTEAFSITTNNVIVLTNYTDLYQLSGSYRYTDALNIEHTIDIHEVTTEPKVTVDATNKIITMLPFDCGTCTNKQYEIKLKYTKP